MKIDDQKYNTNESSEESYYGVGSFIWEVIKVFVWALIIIIPIRIFLFQPFFVQGSSMEPNFKDGDYLIINELGYKQTDISLGNLNLFTVKSFKNFDRGDAIVFRYPMQPETFFIKRVIGLPGERVKIENNKITIYNNQNPDGLVLDEDEYLAKTVITTDAVDMQLKNDEYFVMGDNRTASYDSRKWGPVPEKDIVGKVLLRAWPITKAAVL
jgi:signal peptidase I